jgi:two-component system, chemotaxis family, CheB/CheR fusion protein
VTDEPEGPDFERLLQYLRETRGFDFSGYKRTTLLRRIAKRMTHVHVSDHGAYLDYLQANPDEFAALFNTILINVTSYFRDAEAWDYLQTEILPKIIDGKAPYEPIRVWSAGVASGEEAYSLAMLLSEVLGASEYRERAKIYATDVDEDALTHARQGRATDKDLEEVPADLREKYFEREGDDHYVLRSELRRSIIFGRHDLVQDAPISRIDLLVCRNTLMYFEPEAQARILARLHYALSEKGYLFLGKAEMLIRRDTLFVPVDLKQRIFLKISRPAARDQRIGAAQVPADAANQSPRQGRLRELMVDALPVAQLVVDPAGIVIAINERARSLFGLVPADLGRPLQDLEVSYRPIELRSLIDQAYRDRRPVEARDVERRTPNGEAEYFDAKVVQLTDKDGNPLGASIAFTDVTSYNRVNRELERSKQELETTSEELQATNEELETTNEELQSTVEELETTNEELQSSNEELETMNEELESTNTELETINTEMQQRGTQLDHINVFMQEILANVKTGVAVLDRDLRVQLWNHQSEELWGVRAGETVGQPLLALDIGLPVSELVAPINEAIKNADGFREVTVDATNRRGKRFVCRVQCSAMAAIDGGRGAILLMEAAEPQKTS